MCNVRTLLGCFHSSVLSKRDERSSFRGNSSVNDWLSFFSKSKVGGRLFWISPVSFRRAENNMGFSKWILYKCSAKAVASTRSYEMKRFHWFKGGALELTNCRSQFITIKMERRLFGRNVADDVDENEVS